MTRLYDRLLELPLFLGMSQNDLNNVVAHTKFGFLKVAKGKQVVAEGNACDHLYFLLSGKLLVTSQADDHSYWMTEEEGAPTVLQPERIFGLHQRYSKTFTTAAACSFMSITKSETMRLCESYEIFRLNLLNIISTQSQRIIHQPWRSRPTTLPNKIIRFVEEHSSRPAGTKTLYIKMETLAKEIGESRLNVSRQLNAFDEKGIIQLRRSEIHIPAFERLLAEKE